MLAPLDRWPIASSANGLQTMTSKKSHYLLFAEASRSDRPVQTWRFVLQNLETQKRFCANDSETADCSERLELLAVVRGLEALDGPARVTLVTKSRYVCRGLKSGLTAWRNNNWCWERFGRIVPIRDHDLWQRVDRAMQFHTVDCQVWHFEGELEQSPEVEMLPSQHRIDKSHTEAIPKQRVARGRRGRSITTRRPATTANSVGKMETVWSGVKSIAQSITQPTLEPTA